MVDAILVTSAKNPTVDGYASVMAYTELLQLMGKRPVAAFFGLLDPAIERINKRFYYVCPDPVPSPEIFPKTILLNCSELNGLDPRINPLNVTEIVDHREIHNARHFPAARFQMELVGSTSTMIAERYSEHHLNPPTHIGRLLVCGIVQSTRNLNSPDTNERDTKALYWLASQCEVPEEILTSLYRAK